MANPRWTLQSALLALGIGQSRPSKYELEKLRKLYPGPTTSGQGLFRTHGKSVYQDKIPVEVPSLEEIHRAYVATARLAHPDVGGSTEQMQTLNSAYEFLKKYLAKNPERLGAVIPTAGFGMGEESYPNPQTNAETLGQLPWGALLGEGITGNLEDRGGLLDLLSTTPLGIGMMRLPGRTSTNPQIGQQIHRFYQWLGEKSGLKEKLRPLSKISEAKRLSPQNRADVQEVYNTNPHVREGHAIEEIMREGVSMIDPNASSKVEDTIRKNTLNLYRRLLSEEDVSGPETSRIISEIMRRTESLN